MFPKGAKRPSTRILISLIVLSNVVIQFTLFRSGFDDQIVNQHSPTKSDAYDYVARAEMIADFGKAFSDAYRMPGYPLFLALFIKLFDDPLLKVRIAQVLLTSTIVYFSYLILSAILDSVVLVLAGATAVALWLPFYFFSPILYAESCSLFLLSLLLYLIFAFAERPRFPIKSLALVLALLIYLKPHHVLLLFPVSLFMWYQMAHEEKRIRTQRILKVVGLVVMLILPWSIFVSLKNNHLIPLSSNGGVNLYLGTGAGIKYDDATFHGTLHHQVSKQFQLFDEARYQTLRRQIHQASVSERTRAYTREAIRLWLKRPFETAVYGFAKVLHTFGFSFRDVRDLLLVLQFLASLMASAILWRAGYNRNICLYFWGTLATVAFQSFVFLANQRFKLVLFDLPAIIVIVSSLAPLIRRFKTGRSPSGTRQFKNTNDTPESTQS